MFEKYIEIYGKDKKLHLIPIEGFFQRKDYISTLSCIDKLSDEVNNDPFLNLYRGLIYSEMNSFEQAENRYKAFIVEKPFESTRYFSLLDLYLNNNEFASATSVLNQLSRQFGYYKQDLIKILSRYPDFKNSDDYMNWMKDN